MSEQQAIAEQRHQESFERVEGMAAQIADLEAAIDELRRQLGAQLRTRSVVVVDEDGFERVTISARGDHGAVSVYGRGIPGVSTCSELFANDPVDGDGVHAGVSITDGGEVVASLEVLQGTPPHLYFEAPGDSP